MDVGTSSQAESKDVESDGMEDVVGEEMQTEVDRRRRKECLERMERIRRLSRVVLYGRECGNRARYYCLNTTECEVCEGSLERTRELLAAGVPVEVIRSELYVSSLGATRPFGKEIGQLAARRAGG